MRLPAPPTELRLYPSRLAAEHARALRPGEAEALAAATTFAALWRALGALDGRRFAPPLVCRVLLRDRLASLPAWSAAAGDAYAVRAAQRAVDELRRAGITAGHLAPLATSEPLTALAEVVAGYEQALAAAGLADQADVERLAVLAVVEGRLPPLYRQVRRIVVEGGGSLFGARRDLLAAFAARGVAVRVRLAWDPARPHLFAWSEASLGHLEAGGATAIEVDFDARVGNGPLAALRAAQQTAATASDAPAVLWHLPAGAERARAVADLVADWLAAGTPVDQIAVAVPDLEADGVLLAEALSEREIGAYLRRGRPLAGCAVGRALCDALGVAARGFPREQVLELWRVFGAPVEHQGRRLPAEEVCALVRRSGARSAQVLPFAEALRQADLRAARRADEAPRLGAAVEASLAALCAELDALPEEGPLAEFVVALEQWHARARDEAGTPGAADADDLVLAAAKSAARAARDAVAAVLVELGQAARLGATGPAWRRTEVGDAFRLLLGERRLAPQGARGGSVALLGLDELVETRFARVILCGIDAEAFPRPPPADLVLTEQLRRELNQALGPRLLQVGPVAGRAALHGHARDTWLWMEALAAAREQLVVVFTAADEAAGAGLSELVEELQRSLGGAPFAGLGRALAPPPSLPRLVERWSLESLSGASGGLPPGEQRRARALDEALLVRHGAMLTRLAERLAGEQRAVSHARLDGARAAVVAGRLLEETQSASQVDLLGMCAFRFYAAVLLGLERQVVPALGADAREQGSAAHAALHLVYRDLLARGGLAAARRDRAAALARARAVVDAEAEAILAEVVVHPTLRAATLEDAWAAVAAQLAADLDSAEAWEPVALERRFGGRGSPALAVGEPGGERRLGVRGSIDRVDRVGTAVRVVDYKRTHRRRSPGRHFQLPIYALAALRDLPPPVEALDTAWVTLRDGKRYPAKELPKLPEAFAAQLAADLWAALAPVLDGDVTPAPDGAELCRACDFRWLCRFDAAARLGGEG